MQWHALATDEVLAALDVQASVGLSANEVEQRRATFGRNILPAARGRSALTRFIQQFNNPLIYMLLLSAAVSMILGGITDGGVIIGVVLLNAAIGFVQEGKAAQALSALTSTLITECTVRRNGVSVRIPSADLVRGDVVLLEAGDTVPADLRLLRSHECMVAEAALTGESVAVEKHTSVVDRDAVLADRANMVFASTIVTAGSAIGVVVATGTETEVGAISTFLASTVSLTTPLTQTIEAFSRKLLYGIMLLAALTLLAGLLRGEALIDMVLASVALSVGAIPEGLPAAVTIILAIGVGRMARRRAVIRKLPAVETLGSTTVICSDKTGTLTQNQMTVVAAVTPSASYVVHGTGYAPRGEVTTLDGVAVPVSADLQALARCAVLCNTSDVRETDGEWSALGDPTEAALIVFGMKCERYRDHERNAYPLMDTIPFSSEQRFMATLHDMTNDDADDTSYVAMKGSVEAVLARCSVVDHTAVMHEAERLSAQGLRVLACAHKLVDARVHVLHRQMIDADMHFLGLVAMVDPPREEAVAAIAECMLAGIDVKMITGDHAATAATIAAQLGLKGRMAEGRLVALTGKDLQAMDDETFADAARHVAVFARVSPQQKLRLVEALQADGHVVAMTGDGVNDAPALRTADIGIAMGRSGTDVAKDASAMVLTDDNFATIVHAVEEGRTVFDNLLKFIVWTIPTNIGEGLVIVAAIAMNVALPILPVQVLWINMTTAVILGLPLAFEPLQPDAMRRRPRGRRAPLLSKDLVLRTLFVGLLLLCGSFSVFLIELDSGATLSVARTASSNAFVVMSIFYLFVCRTLVVPVRTVGYWSNGYVWGAAALMLALQMMYTYAPFMNAWFHTSPIDLKAWTLITASGIAAAVLVMLEKRIRASALRS